MNRLASESLDRDLGRVERAALRTHQLYCTPCRRYIRQVLFLRRFAARFEDDERIAGPSLPDEVRDRIKHQLSKH